MAMRAVNKKVQIKTRGKVIGVVREHYLRTDIPCQSDLCFEGCSHTSTASSPSSSPTLPSHVTHYILPLADVVQHFLDILNFTEITGMIFCQSVVNSVNQASLSKYRKLCTLIKDPKKASIFFPNEFFEDTFLPRDPNVPLEMHQAELAYKAAKWYYEHLGGQKPIVMVTEDQEIVDHFASKRLEVFVLRLGEYLTDFWPTLPDVQDVFQGLIEARIARSIKDSDQDYKDYFKLEVLEAGIRQGKFVAGKLSVDKHHAATEAFVHRQSDGSKSSERDILIPGMVLRNRAVHGDMVVVQLLPKSEWRSKITKLGSDADNQDKEEVWEQRADVEPTGRVVGILQRNWREYIATIPKEEATSLNRKSGKRILAFPYDYRIPRIRILTAQGEKLAHERIVVRIDNWPVNSQYPNGHFVRSLGKIGNLNTEIDGILAENEISITPFSQGILAEMPKDDWQPTEEEINQRKDLRKSHFVMSIDPQGCEDVDDTLSVRKLSNGNLELGVHIADVTHFVPLNSLTDLEGRRRATTVYLADRRYDMLPSVLSANVCSLLGNVDRFAVSVLWELDPSTHEVISVWYGRTVIRSAYKLFYEAAQDVINGKSAKEMQNEIPELQGFNGQGLAKKFKALKDALTMLSNIAQSIQTRRERSGALQLESTEVQFEFQRSNLEDIKPKEHLKIHETVAECMILANHWVAKKIAKSFPQQSLLRRHPAPNKENFQELKQCAASRGWHIEVWCNKALAESLNKCNDPKDPVVNFLLRNLATHAMVQAVYFSTGSVNPEQWEHYGLALGQYTHFTSPIRRYADIIVHRLLLAALENQDWWTNSEAKTNHNALMGNSELRDVAAHINERNRAAQQAQRSSQTLFQTLYFKGKDVDDPRCMVEAVIVSVRANGFLVYIPRYALKGPVYMQNASGEVLFCDQKLGPMWVNGVLWKDDHSLHVESVSGHQVFKIFDHVTITIQMKGSDVHPCVLKYYLLSSKPPRSSHQVQLEQGEVNFLDEIRKDQALNDGESNEKETEEVGMDIDEPSLSMAAKIKAKRREKVSMYEFFQKMRHMAVSDE